MKKRIGIVGWKTGDNSFGATIPYLEYISKFGIPIILHPNTPILDLDLLILPGGPDIDTTRYNNSPSLYTQKACPLREYFDKVRLPEYIQKRIPIFGICRGMQSIAVYFKTVLYQNMYHEYSEERNEIAHKIHITEECRNILNIKDHQIGVNSFHHQAIIRETLPDELKVIAIYIGKFDKVAEAIAHTELPISGVQFHPEELYNNVLADGLIEKLLETQESIFVKTPSKILKA